MVGLKQLAKQTPKALKGITLTNNIFTLSKNEAIQQVKTAFIDNVNFFIPVFKKGKEDAFKVIDEVQEKFNDEAVKLVKEKGEALTEGELSGIASKTFSSENLLKATIEKLGWQKLVNKISSEQDTKSLITNQVAWNQPKFIVTNGKIRYIKSDGEIGSFKSSAVKVVINDGKVSYMKPSYLQESMSFENHAQLVKGKPVDGGYTLKFNSNGELVKYNHYSGHYETPEDRISLL